MLSSPKNSYSSNEFELPQTQKCLVGIPTMEGYEFFTIEDIVCCEGFQKCTRVITNHKFDIVSSYNIGEFRKLLQPVGFFSPHKSFLINLSKIKKYHKEGTITMCSGHIVPLARRRKAAFLNQIKNDFHFPIIPQK